MGGGEDIGLNKVKFSRSHPFECYFTEVIAPNNFWWFSRPPPLPLAFIFQANLSGPPFWILPKFSVIPAFGLLVTTDFQFCSPKNQVIPLKSSLPLSQAINNDRSLIELRLRQRPRLTTLYCRRKAMALSGSRHALQDNSPTAQQPNNCGFQNNLFWYPFYFFTIYAFSFANSR